MPATWSARSPAAEVGCDHELVERDELHERRREHVGRDDARLHERVETDRREVALGDVHVDRLAEHEEADERRERARLGVEPAQVDGHLGRRRRTLVARVQEAGDAVAGEAGIGQERAKPRRGGDDRSRCCGAHI